MKICNRCKEAKLASEYHKNSSSPDGLKSICRTCASKSRWPDKKMLTTLDQADFLKDGMKKCNECHEVKELTSYTPAKGLAGGVLGKCKACVNTKRRTVYAPSLAEYSARMRDAGVKRAYTANARAKALGIDERLDTDTWAKLVSANGEQCMNPECGSTDNLVLEHVIPLGQPGGRNHIDNLQILCHSCNVRKRQNTWDYRTG